MTVALPATGKLVEMISDDGEFIPLQNVTEQNGKLVFDYPMAPAGSAMFFVTDTPAGELPPQTPCDPFAGEKVLELDGNWELQNHTGNLLTLDRCRYRVDGGEWQAVDTVSLQRRLLAYQRQCEVDLEFDFDIAEDFDFNSELKLIIEKPQIFKYALNGESFSAQDEGYVFDREFRKLRLPRNLKAGKNTISLHLTYIQTPEQYAAVERAKIFESEYNKLNFTTELENIYLMGDFAVRHIGSVTEGTRCSQDFHGKFELAAPLKGNSVKPAELTTYGAPFFSGKIKFGRKFNLSNEAAESVRFLRCQCDGANSVRAYINGKVLPVRCWDPFAFDVTGLLQSGENEIAMELTTSLRNTMGPFHNFAGESYWISTMSFNVEETIHGVQVPPATESYNLVKLGLRDIELSK